MDLKIALPPRSNLLGLAALVVLVLGSTWTLVGNQWVQDDIFIILSNKTVHTLDSAWLFFADAYWPEPFPRELYRPLTVLLFAVEWAVGGGSPLAYRLVSIALYLGATLSCWRLASRLVPAGPAWCAAALFAVHPVHVEAVAVAVNQAELLVAIILMLAVTAWVDRRRAGLSVEGGWGLAFLFGWFVACLIKEHALVLPALLLAAEGTVLRRPEVATLGRVTRRHLGLAMALVVVVLVWIRDAVLSGNTKGSFTAEALQQQDLLGRTFTMLGVVPEWFRLLIWPHHLQADYSPQEIVPAEQLAAPQLLGIALLALAILLMIATWRRQPVVAFGVLWLGISLGPVHNVLVPTGIVLAERTLFLGSAGFVIGGVALVWWWYHAHMVPSRMNEPVMAGVLALLLALGVARSASRQAVWYDLASFARQGLIDAPLSYRMHHTYAQLAHGAGAKAEAERHYRRAIELYPDSWTVRLDLADKYRLSALCVPAIELYETVLADHVQHHAARASMIACQMHLGRYRDAATTARMAMAHGGDVERFGRYLAAAQDAAQRSVAPGSAALPAMPSTK